MCVSTAAGSAHYVLVEVFPHNVTELFGHKSPLNYQATVSVNTGSGSQFYLEKGENVLRIPMKRITHSREVSPQRLASTHTEGLNRRNFGSLLFDFTCSN